MDELMFVGKVVNGIGKHSELVVPGKHSLPNAPGDWPEKLFAGSLNVRVIVFPEIFAQRGLANSAKSLDVAGFEPEFIIPNEAMINNRLTPLPRQPLRGTAQVWRATLHSADHTASCWILRRIDSSLQNQIEVVSGVGLRKELGLERTREWSVAVKMQGCWRTP